MVESIVCDLLQGTKDEQKEAKKKLDDYKKENKHIIDRNFRRELAQSDPTIHGVNVASAIPAPTIQQTPIMQVPQGPQGPQPKGKPKSEDETRGQKLSDIQIAYQRQVRKELCKGPGGYSIEYHNKRMWEEAFQTLFLDL